MLRISDGYQTFGSTVSAFRYISGEINVLFYFFMQSMQHQYTETSITRLHGTSLYSPVAWLRGSGGM